ncbi:transposase, partial [Brachybacterium muris]|uniref:transposase n=1 Tax=Brachybacterium muris TaxID=219301 RepID=UPI00223A9CEE
AISKARRAAREQAWALAGDHSSTVGASVKSPLVIDLDATLITAHSEKEQAAPTFKRGFGYHPLCAFLDHGSEGTGEPLAIQLRPGNAGSNTAADHITVTKAALAQLPPALLARSRRGSKKILIRTDG